MVVTCKSKLSHAKLFPTKLVDKATLITMHYISHVMLPVCLHITTHDIPICTCTTQLALRKVKHNMKPKWIHIIYISGDSRLAMVDRIQGTNR